MLITGWPRSRLRLWQLHWPPQEYSNTPDFQPGVVSIRCSCHGMKSKMRSGRSLCNLKLWAKLVRTAADKHSLIQPCEEGKQKVTPSQNRGCVSTMFRKPLDKSLLQYQQPSCKLTKRKQTQVSAYLNCFILFLLVLECLWIRSNFRKCCPCHQLESRFLLSKSPQTHVHVFACTNTQVLSHAYTHTHVHTNIPHILSHTPTFLLTHSHTFLYFYM